MHSLPSAEELMELLAAAQDALHEQQQLVRLSALHACHHVSC